MLRDVPESGLRLIPWEEETKTGIREILRDPARSEMKEFVLVVGPEGGFSAGEIELARQAGFLSVSLGKRVLRVETASLAVLAIFQYEKGGRETESTA
jgi:16S rRNA (uracil1498-N3)-methyltransferase